MKAGMIDTNILLHAVNSDSEDHDAAVRFLDSVAGGPAIFYLTDGIIYEFFRVSTHHKVFDRPLDWREAFEFISPVLKSEFFQLVAPQEDHWENLAAHLEQLNHPSGNLFFDIRTAVLMLENGVNRIYTADTDFLQFDEIEVINPLRDHVS